MTRTLLFCVAEEAKPFIPKALREFSTEKEAPPLYYLVESEICPDKREGFRIELQDGEAFNSDFINASKEQCRNWALEKWYQAKVKFIEPNVIAIADEQSARDRTLLMSFYYPEVSPEEPTFEFDGWGPLPPKANTWYDFRIDHRAADEFHGSLMWSSRESAYPIYFGCPEKFTDETGIFNVFKAVKFWPVDFPHAVHKHANKFWRLGSGQGIWNYSSVAEAVADYPDNFNLVNPPYRDTFLTEFTGTMWVVLRYQMHLDNGMAMAILDEVDMWPEVPDKYAFGYQGFSVEDKNEMQHTFFQQVIDWLDSQVPASQLGAAIVASCIAVWAVVRPIAMRKERKPMTINHSPLASGSIVSQDDKDGLLSSISHP